LLRLNPLLMQHIARQSEQLAMVDQGRLLSMTWALNEPIKFPPGLGPQLRYHPKIVVHHLPIVPIALRREQPTPPANLPTQSEPVPTPVPRQEVEQPAAAAEPPPSSSPAAAQQGMEPGSMEEGDVEEEEQSVQGEAGVEGESSEEEQVEGKEEEVDEDLQDELLAQQQQLVGGLNPNDPIELDSDGEVVLHDPYSDEDDDQAPPPLPSLQELTQRGFVPLPMTAEAIEQYGEDGLYGYWDDEPDLEDFNVPVQSGLNWVQRGSPGFLDRFVNESLIDPWHVQSWVQKPPKELRHWQVVVRWRFNFWDRAWKWCYHLRVARRLTHADGTVEYGAFLLLI
jgi:hypothetical protein